MARLPTRLDLSGPGSYRTGRGYASADTSGAGRALANLGQSIAQAGDVLKSVDVNEQRRQDALDVARADAEWTKRDLARKQAFEGDTDYATFGKRFQDGIAKDRGEVAGLIRNPQTREKYLALKAEDEVRSGAWVTDLATRKQKAFERSTGFDTLDTLRNQAIDPKLDDASREKAKTTIKATIDTFEQTGLLSPDEARQARKVNIEDANLSFAKLWAAENPGALLPQMQTDAVQGTVSKIIGAESSGDANAKNPRSSASGLGQFTNDTWIATLDRHRPDLAGLSRSEKLALKTDPTLGREMTARHTEDNGKDLAASGFPVTEGNLYLAHFAGIGGAKRVLSAEDTRPVIQVLGPDAVKANPFLQGKDVGWLKAWAAKKMGDAPPAMAPGAKPPNYADLTPEQRYSSDQFSEGVMRQEQVRLRAEMEDSIVNAPAAIQQTGSYTGEMPTAQQFVQAYGEDGIGRFQQFQTAVETSQAVYDMKTMPNADIQRMVESATPTSNGDQAALEGKRYEVISSAAAGVLKAREADPVGYVQRTFAPVAAAWEGVQNGSVSYSQAINATVAAQAQIGIPADKIQPIPQGMADGAAAKFKNAELPESERVAALTSTLFATGDPAQQKAIYSQLVKAGVPEHVEGALRAIQRGDEAASRRLMQAALVDPTKLPGKISDKEGDVKQAIQDALMADDTVGDVFYGLSAGNVENYTRAQNDAMLLTRAVQMRLVNGEDLATAVEKAGKDLYGDVEVVTGNGDVNAKILVPTGTDATNLVTGLQKMRPQVYEALTAAIRPMVSNSTGVADLRAPSYDASSFGARPDGTPKGTGFLGVLQRPDGGVMTEFSVGVQINGKEMDVPTLVPTLTRGEVETLLNLPDGTPPPDAIIEKAQAFAERRIAEGKPVFATPADVGDLQGAVYGAASGARAVINAATQNHIENIMDEGYFVQMGDGFGFIDPYTNAAVMAADGRPLTFSADQVNATGAAAIKARNAELAPPPEPTTLLPYDLTRPVNPEMPQ